MFRVKICGITSCDDALAAEQAGADAIGLNFHSRSVRHVSMSIAAEIVELLGESVRKIGVFVDAPPAEVVRIARELRLDAVQLHGDQPPQYVAQLDGIPAIRAFRGADKLAGVPQYLEQVEKLGATLSMVLVDAFDEHTYGGTGRQADWARIARERAGVRNVPLVLAGGLTPENVGSAIAMVGPDAVDTASGVESAPGRKSRTLMADFVAAARAAIDHSR